MGPVPKGAFLTKGVGRHREKLTSFELALRSAGIAEFNLVRVKSVSTTTKEMERTRFCVA
jgi:arginine decarboxylase